MYMFVHSSSLKEKDYWGEHRIALKDLQLSVIDYRVVRLKIH